MRYQIESPKCLCADGKAMTEVNQGIGKQIFWVLRKLMLRQNGDQVAHAVRVQIREQNTTDNFQQAIDPLNKQAKFKADMNNIFSSYFHRFPLDVSKVILIFPPIMGNYDNSREMGGTLELPYF